MGGYWFEEEFTHGGAFVLLAESAAGGVESGLLSQAVGVPWTFAVVTLAVGAPQSCGPGGVACLKPFGAANAEHRDNSSGTASSRANTAKLSFDSVCIEVAQHY